MTGKKVRGGQASGRAATGGVLAATAAWRSLSAFWDARYGETEFEIRKTQKKAN
jgi:hypothetical protein